MRPFFFVLLLLTMILHPSFAQQSLKGSWQGSLPTGGKQLRVVMHLKPHQGRILGRMDSPDQGGSAIPCDSVTTRNDSLFVTLMFGQARFQGKISGDTAVVGTWLQGTARIPLTLHKTDKPAGLNRPQTPQPPFPYTSEEVNFFNADKSISYGATITFPKGGKSAPAVLLISGSGPQNRDEELYGHKPFAVIADYLTKKGYVVLRVDDRGVWETGGDRSKATSMDFADDAEAALDYLKTRKEADKSKIGLLGHSEGGMIGPVVAARRKDVAFLILMAAPGVPIPELMEEQNAAMLRTSGMADSIITLYRPVYRQLAQIALDAKDTTEAMSNGLKVVHDWKTAHPGAASAMGIIGYTGERNHVNGFISTLHDPWFNTFFRFNPQPYLEQLHCKVLALNGEKDVQVSAPQNLEGIRKSLAKSKAKPADAVELLGLNHLFQTCKRCNAMEYSMLEETIAPLALQTIGDWMDKNVK